MKPRSWMILILAIGVIAVAIGIVLGLQDLIVTQFNVSPFSLDAFEEFIRQYVAGLRVPTPIT